MKKNPWFKHLENASLLGSGVGAVASIVLNQASYAVAPLTLALALGALNRSRENHNNRQHGQTVLSEFNDRFTLEVRLMKQQIAALPSPETIHRLKKSMMQQNRELSEELFAEVALVQGELHRRLVTLEEQGFNTIRQDLQFLGERYTLIMAGFEQLHEELAQGTDSARVAHLEALIRQLNLEVTQVQRGLETLTSQTQPNFTLLQEQLSRLDREFRQLPPPADISSIRQDMNEITKLIAELAPKQDLVSLTEEVQDVQRQQEALRELLQAMEMANFRLGTLASADRHSTDEDAQHSEESNFYPNLQEVAIAYLSRVRSQLESVQLFADKLADQQRQLQVQMQDLPPAQDIAALQRQLRDLSKRLPATENVLNTFKTRVRQVVQQELEYINLRLRSLPTAPKSELVFDASLLQADATDSPELLGSSILSDALDQTHQRLIIIWPWSPHCSLDQALIEKLEAYLQSDRRLDMGWCHQVDRNVNRFLGKMQRGWMADTNPSDPLQDSLRRLLGLKQAYPDRFQFKILGTTENFLVSDRTMAVLGITETLQTATQIPELQLKLRTRDPEMIDRLVQRYDQPTLEATDLDAYWNRAVTRYDLGDKLGAIADYTHILGMNPDDAITYNYRGLAYYDCGNRTAAIADFTASIARHPDQVAAYCNRAFIYSEQGDLDRAISDYNHAIHIQPDCAIAHFYRAMTWQKLDNHQEAIADYTETIELTPDSAVARYYRGLAWQKVDNIQGAIADLEHAAALFEARGNANNAQKALKQLAKLRQLLAVDPDIGTEFGIVPATMIEETTSIAS
ncbi:tetratricopeptide repeat protein [Thermocoleostomius sinensis]|uniref:Tetratricopeptide repeat protein n=1 Tax=Thermocoleostomius sinensis A174 TaxID=2016057 RepID=A0A9E8ZD92_9CYAN|nr:tetratricopeptide repeat protein [Thermocoleostomius sinensis]WAL59273.1 tetratricopeptide repeat protein [Thermocoleostomius sinensis A174]